MMYFSAKIKPLEIYRFPSGFINAVFGFVLFFFQIQEQIIDLKLFK